ncbi:MAG: hypothetical protein GY771_08815 [bacterium]|nr:hypothetical protein [bacterium]
MDKQLISCTVAEGGCEYDYNYVNRERYKTSAFNEVINFIRARGEQITETVFYGVVLTGIVLLYTILAVATMASPASDYEILTRDYVVIEAVSDE